MFLVFELRSAGMSQSSADRGQRACLAASHWPRCRPSCTPCSQCRWCCRRASPRRLAEPRDVPDAPPQRRMQPAPPTTAPPAPTIPMRSLTTIDLNVHARSLRSGLRSPRPLQVFREEMACRSRAHSHRPAQSRTCARRLARPRKRADSQSDETRRQRTDNSLGRIDRRVCVGRCRSVYEFARP